MFGVFQEDGLAADTKDGLSAAKAADGGDDAYNFWIGPGLAGLARPGQPALAWPGPAWPGWPGLARPGLLFIYLAYYPANYSLVAGLLSPCG